jgi:hypothetical protein
MPYCHLPIFDGVRRLDPTTLLRRPIDRPIALVQGLKPHPQKLELQEVDAKSKSWQNQYKQGECYPYHEEQQE